MEQIVRWHVYPSAKDLVVRAAQAILRIAAEAIAARGAFYIVLAGGETPLAVYKRLRTAEAGWPAWHVYFGDERCLPRDDVGRNDTAIRRAWLAHVAIPPAQVHAIPAEQGPESGAAAYARLLASVDDFDLVLLGLGEDGHTASLFPGTDPGAAAHAPDTLAVTSAPKPPPARVSLSARRLAQTRQVLFLVQGAGKRAAVAAWRRCEDIPARHVSPAGGVDVLLDAAAMAWGISPA